MRSRLRLHIRPSITAVRRNPLLSRLMINYIGAFTELMIRYQANTGRRKCILLLVLIILGLILVLIYKPRSTSSPITPTLDSPLPSTEASLPPSSDISDPGGGFAAPDSDEIPDHTDEVGDMGGGVDVADVVGGTEPWLRPPSVPPIVNGGDETRVMDMRWRGRGRRREPGLDAVY